MAEKLTIERYKLAHGKQHCDIFLDDLDIATVYEEKYVHLLAAAPMMLEALMQVAAIYDNSVGFPASAFRAVMPTVKAAIAAAEGE